MACIACVLPYVFGGGFLKPLADDLCDLTQPASDGPGSLRRRARTPRKFLEGVGEPELLKSL